MQKAFFTVIMIMIPFFTALLVLETYLRVTDYPEFFAYRIADEDTDMWHLPNKEGEIVIPGKDSEFVAHVKTNSFGMLDHEYTVEKPADTYRIALLGDSFAAGLEVIPEERLPTLLEKQLREETGKKIEVMNFGVRTISPASELQIYNTKARQFKPDMVIQIIYLHNDLGDTDAFYRDNFPDPLIDGSHEEFRLDKKVEIMWRRMNVMINDTFISYPFIRLRYDMLEKKINKYYFEWRRKQDHEKNTAPPPEAYKTVTNEKGKEEIVESVKLSEKEILDQIDRQRQFALLYKLIKKQKENSERDGAKYFVFLTDHKTKLVPEETEKKWRKFFNTRHSLKLNESEYSHDLEYKALERFCMENGINFVDLMQKYQSMDEPLSTFWKSDIHWNQKGHSVVSEVMFDTIVNSVQKDTANLP